MTPKLVRPVQEKLWNLAEKKKLNKLAQRGNDAKLRYEFSPDCSKHQI